MLFQNSTEQIAQSTEVISTLRASLMGLQTGHTQLQTDIEDNRAEQAQLNQKINESEAKLLESERAFYSRIIPLFAIFMTAFALIVTGSQAIIRTTATDPWLILGQSIAMMGPITVFVLALLLAAWVLVRPRSPKPGQPGGPHDD
jgi:hypothetical protein